MTDRWAGSRSSSTRSSRGSHRRRTNPPAWRTPLARPQGRALFLSEDAPEAADAVPPSSHRKSHISLESEVIPSRRVRLIAFAPSYALRPRGAPLFGILPAPEGSPTRNNLLLVIYHSGQTNIRRHSLPG